MLIKNLQKMNIHETIFSTKQFLPHVFLVHVQRKMFDWKLPHQSIFKNGEETRGTAFFLDYQHTIYLITCFHVVRDALHVTISSPSHGAKEYPCHVQWICPELDLAVLNVIPPIPTFLRKKGLSPKLFSSTPIRVSTSSKKTLQLDGPHIGDTTYTIGFPLGQDNLKMTKGILSGQQYGLFQTDAPMNGGNSGGPLVHKNKVIGINVSGYSFAQNVAYAIPVTRLLHLLDYVSTQKKTSSSSSSCQVLRLPRSWGIQIQSPSKDLSLSSSKFSQKGVVVTDIFPHQLFSQTHLQKGDILTHLEGIPISSSLGEMDVMWMNQKLNIFSFFYHIYLGQTLSFTYQSRSQSQSPSTCTERMTITPESSNIVFREWYPPHEDIPYLYLCGMVLVPFSVNIAKSLYQEEINPWGKRREENPYLRSYIEDENPSILIHSQPSKWTRGKVMVSNILKGSQLYESHLVKCGQCIEKINGKMVSSIPMLHQTLLTLFGKKETVVFELDNGWKMKIPFRFFIQEEGILSRMYNYSSSLLSSLSS